MNDKSVESDQCIVEEIISRRGALFVKTELDKAQRSDDDLALTIVSNAGVHPIPIEYAVGELYIASEGSFDFSNIGTVTQTYDEIISRLHAKLLEKSWKRIYLFPFGHSTLCMAIKIGVYRTLRIETIDIFYFGEGRYDYLERDTRSAITG